LIKQFIGSNGLPHFIYTHRAGNEFFFGRNIHAVDTRRNERRRIRRKVYFFSAGIPCHFDNLFGRVSADNTIVDQKHIFSLKFERNRVEFVVNGFLSHALSRHDEGSADVPVFHKPFAVFDSQFGGDRNRRAAGAVRNRNHDINFKFFQTNFFCQ